ncbi:hypothetical protein PVAG01_01492 [Phlyctema vagabunda]|uniref:Uncharacterized protein n=1 Tax=Phlyctema vagabunda TaxID=108571 RepID=A0ABR4PX98_9HELO
MNSFFFQSINQLINQSLQQDLLPLFTFIMSLFRPSLTLSRVARRSAPAGVRQPLAVRNLSSSPYRFSTQGYGDGKGDPKAENPQDQGKSNKTKENGEHPGPEPVAEGQGTGAGPTKGGSGNGSGKTPADASAQSGGSRSKEAKETGSSPTGGSVGGQSEGKTSGADKSESKSKSKNGADPKISDRDPGVNSPEKQKEVDQHNKEFEQRHDRAAPAADDKVDKKFWSGQGGADKES